MNIQVYLWVCICICIVTYKVRGFLHWYQFSNTQRHTAACLRFPRTLAVRSSQRCAAKSFPNQRIALELALANETTASLEMEIETSKAACHQFLVSRNCCAATAIVHVDVHSWAHEVVERGSSDLDNLQTCIHVASHWIRRRWKRWFPEFPFLHPREIGAHRRKLNWTQDQKGKQQAILLGQAGETKMQKKTVFACKCGGLSSPRIGEKSSTSSSSMSWAGDLLASACVSTIRSGAWRDHQFLNVVARLNTDSCNDNNIVDPLKLTLTLTN